ncbi:MAG: carboxypeptidase regulatory-like domain-containing protein [Acidobacteria bacterium]|nr:carboxypeptidase regulatory-like domain-containing protein [Acidobacteriota bacterium]MCA1610176.1 carboxypeptidase regulatory-like domain-containing protein [Acidobacteriota bacterium]MCA1617236.1 carboxypeptidase regulatory-like domain-containing protein [Acidobacteriota bacterium]
MLKRSLLLFLLVPALALSLTACGGKDEDAEADEDATPAAKSAAAAPAGGTAPAAAPATGGATLTGKVTFTGGSPAKETIKMDADAFCKSAHSAPVYTEEAVVNANGTLDWVLVYVKDVQGKFPAPTTAVTLDQRGCQYHPHVFGLQAGQDLKIINSDGTLHNIHALPKVNAEFNIGQPFPKMETIKKFDKPEVPVRFKCDVHKWMGAYAGVFTHPFFATTSDQGTFEIKNLPPGTYTVEAWHEKYGTQTSSVTVSGTETKTVDFGFKG